MTDQMTRIKQESEKRYPDIPGAPENTTLIVNMRAAFIAGRAISREQVEQAAKGWSDAEIEAYGVGPYDWSQRDEQEKIYIRSFARAALEAAGLVIEE